MSGFKRYWAKQFGNPTGFGGRIATFIMNRMNGAMYRAVIGEAPEEGRILDVGFGNGEVIRRLSRRTAAGIYGADISADMVATAAKRNAKDVKSGKVTVKTGSAESLPYSGSFDYIYTVNTVYFWNDLDAGCKAIADKLKDGGVFINAVYTKEWLDKLSYTNYGFCKYSSERLLTAAGKCGLNAEIVEIEKEKSYYIKAVK